MSQTKLKIESKTQTWNPIARYRVGDSCIHQNHYWTNKTGFNSDPSLGSDWVIGAFIGSSSTIQIDGYDFRFVGNNVSSIQLGDFAVGGKFTYQSKLFFGDLICIDNTGDLTTGISIKWKPFNLKEIN